MVLRSLALPLRALRLTSGDVEALWASCTQIDYAFVARRARLLYR